MKGNSEDVPPSRPSASPSSADPTERRPLFPPSSLPSSLGTSCFPFLSCAPAGPACVSPPSQPPAWPGAHAFSFLPFPVSSPSAPVGGFRPFPAQPLWPAGSDSAPRGPVSAPLPCASPIYFPPPLICPPSVVPVVGVNPPVGPLSPLLRQEVPEATHAAEGEARSRGDALAGGSVRAEEPGAREDAGHVPAEHEEGGTPGEAEKPANEGGSLEEGLQRDSDPSKDTIRFVPLDQVFPSPEEQASYASAMASVYAGQLDVWYWYSRQLSMQLDLLRLSSTTASSQPLGFLSGLSPDGNDVLLTPNGLLAEGFASPLSSPLTPHGGALRPEETPASPSPIDTNTGSRLGGVGAVFRLCGLEFCFGRNPGAQGAGANSLGLHNPDALGYSVADNFRGNAASAASGQEVRASGPAPPPASGSPSHRPGTDGEAEAEVPGEAGGRINNAWDQYNIGVFVKLLLLLFLFDAGREVYIVTLLFLLMHVNGFFDPLITWMRQNSHTQPLEVTLARLRHRRERRPLQLLQRQQRELRTSTDMRRQERGIAATDETRSSEAESGASASSSSSMSSSVSFAPSTSTEAEAPGLRRRVLSREGDRDERREGREGHERESEQEEGRDREREAFGRPTYLQRVLYQGVVMFFLTFLPWWNPDPIYLVQDDEEDEVDWPVNQAQSGAEEEDAAFAERVDHE
ncbi:hypothetical protein TGGT1_225840 [Toxoplasma gondii GT1]|uniref:Uncharacterized protein n=4 Tax=Toxoplasma gondii TaxID=5811 RepID=S7UWW4_TOXGG|nr:hypothetical protein TGGT1_225840 [Toxoplasma gondii GT1]KAF4640621.1 hypothetical protein TGRH88_045470 [Toxoplasma gondii]KFG55115.1 hypothetical protein TGFOU_225840 [Toxoplasma gondii FOU]PUA91201.1 hypothetical protein TGBR9_225840 [Toxoplasma gondii TgCATBr9]